MEVLRLTLALALLAQRGNVSAMPRENGGQPGQKQWAFDNMRTRTDYDMLYPCCADGSPDARAPAFVDAMRPYEPVDEDNFDYRDAWPVWGPSGRRAGSSSSR